ncbi:MAG: DUF1569 domain-containing protein [Chitinophagaceae bacterium]|nr:DUF1569 domain-containing protein [Chitinophagaceae bacterium]
MYANIFTDINYAEIVNRLKKLNADAERKWGTMTPAEMIRHCRAQIDFILNPSPDVKIYPTMFRFSPVRWLALYGIPWPKNSKTAPELDVTKKLTDTTDFDNEKHLILQGLHNLYHADHVEAIHPLFGKMGKNQWGRVVWKHLDHHLRQFGV